MNPVHVAVEKNISIVMGGNKVIFFVLALMGMFICDAMSQSVVNEEPALERMLEVYAQKNKSQAQVKAWRIQIGAMTDRREMEAELERFENVFPYYNLEWTYDNPYYLLKLKNRAYKYKLDALTILHELKDEYPSAIVILDDVPREDLLKMSMN